MSVVQVYGLHTNSHCGYCKNDGSASYGMSCARMKASDYEAMMLRGWRRSGSYYYKPDLKLSCCKLNTIRLDVNQFQINKKQRKIMNKFEAFINGTPAVKQENKASKREETKVMLTSLIPQPLIEALETAITLLCSELGVETRPEFVKIQRNTGEKVARFGTYTCAAPMIVSTFAKKGGLEVTPIEAAERLVGHLAPLLPALTCVSTPQGYINITDPQAASNPLPVSEPSPLPPSAPVKRTYTLTVKDSDFDEESYQVYRKYQIAIHHDPPGKVTRDQYTSFLCNSSLVKDNPVENGPGLGYGSYHFQHRLDGTLFAVGVCDILPTGFSSVYFFYDPEMNPWNIGTWSAVKEIEWIRERAHPVFRYYYMGFYIETCVKMRYKGEFAPSELLCPETYRWVPLSLCLPTKAEHQFLRLAQCSPDTIGLPVEPDMDLSTIPNVQQFLVNTAMVVFGKRLVKLQTLQDNLKLRIVFYLQDALPYLGQTLLSRLLFSF